MHVYFELDKITIWVVRINYGLFHSQYEVYIATSTNLINELRHRLQALVNMYTQTIILVITSGNLFHTRRLNKSLYTPDERSAMCGPSL